MKDVTAQAWTEKTLPAIPETGDSPVEVVLPPSEPTNAELFADSQPHNRQYYRAMFRATDKGVRNFKRKQFIESIKHKPNPHPEILPTHLIHEIYKKRHVSIHWKQHRIGMVGTTCVSAANTVGKKHCGRHTTVFNKSLFWKIIKRRGKKQAVRKLMENHSRWVNQHAA